MTRPDYELKARVLHTDFVKIRKEFDYLMFQLTCSDIPENAVPLMLDRYHVLNAYLSSNLEFSEEAKKINNANYHRVKRLSQRINDFILDSPKTLFLTFTFNDSTLASTNSQTRKKYVSRWLKKYCDRYIANVDFGKTNDREHYHAVATIKNKIPLNSWYDCGYGALKSETIRKTSNNEKLARYISKLTNHAIKETNKRCVLIYSRKTLGPAA